MRVGNKAEQHCILGIDPGLRKTGWGLVVGRGNSLIYRDCGVINPPNNDTIENRLAALHYGISQLVNQLQPDGIAIEETFVNRDPAGALKLGMARGACLAATSGYSVEHYAPNKIKKTIVGAGHADKAQIAAMIRVLLPRAPQKLPEDAADALAVAICHLHHL